MKYGQQTSLKTSLAIQGRVIGALLMREIITRYGRNHLGFLWLFLEPLLMTIFLVFVWKLVRADKISDLNIVAFVITGYPLAMMWRNVTARAMGAIHANMPLMYHRNVRLLDCLLSRMILEIAGATVAQISIISLLVFVGWISLPDDPFYMLMAWVLMALFAIGLGLVLSACAFYFEPLKKIWGIFSFLLLPLSGVFFFVYSLPMDMQPILLRIPMVNGTEMFRHGYFGSSMITLESPFYLIFCDLILLFIGLLLIAKCAKKLRT